VLASGQYVLGDEVAAFEEEFAKFCGAGYGVAVNTGTSALHLALLAAGVGPGDEVITVPFTLVASAAAIDMTGARPVLVGMGTARRGAPSSACRHVKAFGCSRMLAGARGPGIAAKGPEAWGFRDASPSIPARSWEAAAKAALL